jgi:biotin operon repressor
MATPRQGAERLRKIARQLAGIATRVERRQAKREELDRVVVDIQGVQVEQFGARRRAKRGEGAKRKILVYFLEHVGQPVSGEQLRIVSGIGEWARRLRELRVAHGYDIREVGDSAYQLESATPNQASAAQWQLANEIRKRPGSGRSRIEAFLEANVGQVVTREQIDYVAKIAEGSRRVRELRDEAGWPINSHIDEPELDPGSYRLLSINPADRRDPSQRLYPEGLRERVFKRDKYTCQVCKRDRAAALLAGDTRFYLEVHHKLAVAEELEELDEPERHKIEHLITLCHSDHVKETAALQERKRRQRRGR